MKTATFRSWPRRRWARPSPIILSRRTRAEKNTGIGGNGIETFLYVVQGEVDVQNADEKATLTEDGYFFSPDDKPVTFENKSGKEAKIYVYRKRHESWRATARIQSSATPTTFRGCPTREWTTA